jgi:hypothetical protein
VLLKVKQNLIPYLLSHTQTATVKAVYNFNISPIQVDQAIYGSTDVQFKNFLAPGV